MVIGLLLLAPHAGVADDMILTGTGQKAGTFTLNGGIPISFSGVNSFNFDAGDMDDEITSGALLTHEGAIANEAARALHGRRSGR